MSGKGERCDFEIERDVFWLQMQMQLWWRKHREGTGALRGNSEVSREEENISVGSVPAGEMEEAGGGALVRKGSSSGAKQLRVWCSYHD